MGELAVLIEAIRPSNASAIKLLHSGYVDDRTQLVRGFTGEVVETLDQRATSELVGLFAQLVPAEQMRCHLPRYSVVFQRSDGDEVEVAPCFQCNNARTRLGTEQGWFTFDGSNGSAEQLLARLRRRQLPNEGDLDWR